MRIHLSSLTFILLLFCSVSFTAIAQEEMSLAKAIQIGLNNNYQIKLVLIEEKIATTNNEFGVPERLPRITLNLREYNRLNIDSSPTSFVDGSYTKSEFTAGIDASWTIYEGNADKINKKRLEELTKLSTGHSQLVLQNTIYSIILAYYNAVIESEKLNVYVETLRLSEDKKNNAEALFDFGDIAKHDFLNFKNAYLHDSISYQQQSINYNKTLVSLKYLIGYNTNDSLILTNLLDFETEIPDFHTLEQAFLSNNIDIQNEIINVNLAQHQIGLAESTRRPSIEVRSGISEELGTSKFTGENRERGAVFDYYLSLGLKYNIFNGYREKQRIEVAKLEKNMALVSVDEKKQNLKEQLKINHEDYKERKRILNTQQRLINNLTESLDLYKERYESGYSVFIEYRNAQMELLDAQLKSLESVYQLKLAETEILRLIGGFISKN